MSILQTFIYALGGVIAGWVLTIGIFAGIGLLQRRFRRRGSFRNGSGRS